MIVALSADLMDRSRFPAGTAFVRAAEQLVDGAVGGADVIAVDLAVPGAVDAVRRLRAAGSSARIVAYGSHVDRERLAAAREAGSDRVLARSVFFADVATAVAAGPMPDVAPDAGPDSESDAEP